MAFHAFVVCNGLVTPLSPLVPSTPTPPSTLLLSHLLIPATPRLLYSICSLRSPTPSSSMFLCPTLLYTSIVFPPPFHPLLPSPPPFVQNGLWGTVDRGSSSRDPLVTYPCPAGYCRCFVRTIKGPQTCDYVLDSENFNRQCSCDREGQCVCCMCLCV